MTTRMMPGLVDIQVNGYRGHDVNATDVTPAEIVALTEALWSVGTTRYLPTVITNSEDRMLASIRAVVEARRQDPRVGESIVGIHLEGPHLSPEPGARGAHDPDWIIDPDPALLDRFVEAGEGLVRIVTLAPETPGSADFIRHAVDKGILCSIGHCLAEPDDVRDAVAAGATLSTHLGNGSPATIPRHPNQIWSQLAADELTATFITDGHHLPPETATAMIRAKSVARSILISDSAALAGMAPGEYDTPVGGKVLVTPDGALRLPGTPLLAGSGASLLDCVLWAERHLPFSSEDILAMASTQPAALLGIDISGDAITVDGRAVTRTVVAGDVVHAHP